MVLSEDTQVRKKRPEQTKHFTYLLPLDLGQRISDEAKSLKVFKNHVVERRLEHSYRTSPKLPTKPAA